MRPVADHPFETEAARLFASAPDFDDSAAFAAGIEVRLAQYARMRGWMLGSAGGVGLLFAIRALANADLTQRYSAWAQGLADQAASLSQSAGLAGANPQLWLWSALAVCVAGLVAGGILQRS